MGRVPHRNLAIWTGAAIAAAMLSLGLAAGNARAQRAASSPADEAAHGIALDRVPIPHRVHSRAQPIRQGKTALVPLDTAPFPYNGIVPRSGRPFLDVEIDGRKGHRTGGGRVLWEDETFSDRRVLLHIPQGFDVRRPGVMIVFFHGHGATLGDDVFRRQQVPAQLTMARTNAVLVAPQLAVNAADSSIGKLWQPGGFARLLGEAARELAKLHGDPKTQRTFATMPVVIVAYSGGYVAAAWSAHHGGLNRRLRGIILFDALYGEVDKFADWILKDRSRVFVSAYTSSTRARNHELQRILTERSLPVFRSFDAVMGAGGIAFLDIGSGSAHRDFVTQAWARHPIADFLGRLNGYARQ